MAQQEPQMDMGPIPGILGEDMPHITPTPLGRLRLTAALRNKFGASYKNIPHVADAIQHFDNQHAYFKKIRSMKGVK